jgi:hypothetical protein
MKDYRLHIGMRFVQQGREFVNDPAANHRTEIEESSGTRRW